MQASPMASVTDKVRKRQTLYSIEEVADLCNVSHYQVRRWIKTGNLRAINASATTKIPLWRIDPAALCEFLERPPIPKAKPGPKVGSTRRKY